MLAIIKTEQNLTAMLKPKPRCRILSDISYTCQLIAPQMARQQNQTLGVIFVLQILKFSK